MGGEGATLVAGRLFPQKKGTRDEGTLNEFSVIGRQPTGAEKTSAVAETNLGGGSVIGKKKQDAFWKR